MYHIKYRLYCIKCDEVVFVVKSILIILLTVLVVLGICELLYILKMIFFYPGVRLNNYALVVLKSNFAVKQLNYIWQKIKWLGDSYAVGIIAISDNLDENEILNCIDFICGKNIVLCSSNLLTKCKYLQGDN